MGDIDMGHFRSYLLAAREQLLALQGTRKASAATVTLAQSSIGRLSRMDALQPQAVAQTGQERAARELLRIEAALRRCAAGSYGYCSTAMSPLTRAGGNSIRP